MNKSTAILGVRIDLVTWPEVLSKIQDLLAKPRDRGYQLVTTNPEFIVRTQSDARFKNIINAAWLSVADGYGLRLAAKYDALIKHQKPNISPKLIAGAKVAWWGITRNDQRLNVVTDTIHGADLVMEMSALASFLDKKLFLLGGFGQTPRLVSEKLKKTYPGLRVDYSVFENSDLMGVLRNSSPDVLFVAVRHPRAQIWIDENLKKFPSVKLAIGVGGAFDYMAGVVKRAPANWRGSYEWLFRLLRQPTRLRRIWRAVVVFPWLVFRANIKPK